MAISVELPMRSIEWFQRKPIITHFKKFWELLPFFSFQRNNLLKVFVSSLFVPIYAYNYFYMIEIIRAAHSIIPAAEVPFLSLHMYLYSKDHTLSPGKSEA